MGWGSACRESWWRYKKCVGSGWRCRDQGGNVSIVVEMTQNSNGNDKFKELREFKMGAFVKTQFHTFDLVPFLLTLGIFCTMFFCFYYWFLTGKYRLGRLSKMEDLCHFHINSFGSSFQTFSIQSGTFFYIPIYRVYYTLPCHNFKASIQKGKKPF